MDDAPTKGVCPFKRREVSQRLQYIIEKQLPRGIRTFSWSIAGTVDWFWWLCCWLLAGWIFLNSFAVKILASLSCLFSIFNPCQQKPQSSQSHSCMAIGGRWFHYNWHLNRDSHMQAFENIMEFIIKVCVLCFSFEQIQFLIFSKVIDSLKRVISLAWMVELSQTLQV